MRKANLGDGIHVRRAKKKIDQGVSAEYLKAREKHKYRYITIPFPKITEDHLKRPKHIPHRELLKSKGFNDFIRQIRILD